MPSGTPHLTNPRAWLDAYGRLRTTSPGHPSEWLGTPLAIAGLVAWLWSLPVPDAFFAAGIAVNWGTVFLMAAVVYYFILSITLAFGALPIVVAIATGAAWLDRFGLPLGQIGSSAFVIAIGWQLFASRNSAGGALLVARLQHLMIGPLWLLAALYRRLKLPI